MYTINSYELQKLYEYDLDSKIESIEFKHSTPRPEVLVLLENHSLVAIDHKGKKEIAASVEQCDDLN